MSKRIIVPDGKAGVKAKIKLVWRLIKQGWQDPKIRQKAEQIIRDVPARDKEAEARAVFSWVKDRFHFVKERVEQFKSPARMLKEIALTGKVIEDCDSATILIGALVGSLGIGIRTVVIGTDRNYYHIFPEARINSGWIPMDIIGRKAEFGKPANGFTRRINTIGDLKMDGIREQVARRFLKDELSGIGISKKLRKKIKKFGPYAAGAASVLLIQKLAIPGFKSLLAKYKAARKAKRTAKKQKELLDLERQLRKIAPEMFTQKSGMPAPEVIQQSAGITLPEKKQFDIAKVALILIGLKVTGIF